MSKAVEERADISQTVGQNHRENVRSSEGHPSGSSTIQASTTLENQALFQGHQSYESLIQITPECKAELQWWIESVPQWNGRSVIRPSPDLSINITTDASRRGWGAHCAGVKTQGLWTPEEQKLHINALEIKAVMFTVKAFTKDKSQVNVHLWVDNTTTMSYINKMGGTKSTDMINISKALWDYCLSKQITLTAEFLPGIQNQIADAQSRNYQDSSNWKLNKSIFQEITRIMGQVEIDLFADRTNAQVPKFISWKPDPESSATDAFTVSWSRVAAYAFPPFCLIGRCLAKIRQDQASVIMITPTWQTQPWYPEIMSMLISDPILLHPVPNLITSPLHQQHPLHNHGLALAAWQLSGDKHLQHIYQKKLKVLQKSRRDSSQSTYKTPWRKWTSWCDREQIDPIDATVEQIADFLADRFQNH